MVSEASPDPERPKPLRLALPHAQPPAPDDDVITLNYLFSKIWRGKWIVAATTAVFVCLVAGWIKFTDPLYTARMVIAPASETGASGLAGRLAQYSGIASLAGIDLPADQAVTPFAEFIELMTSVVLAERLQDKYTVLPVIFEGDWDAENSQWAPPSHPVAWVKGGLYAFFGLPAWTPPSAGALAEVLGEELEIVDAEGNGMRAIAFRHTDPQFALSLLQWMHKEGDDLIRETALKRHQYQIAYIEEKLADVNLIEHRQSLIQLLSDQEKQMMMVQVDLPFAARFIEPPAVSDKPTSPKPLLLLPLGVIAGFFFGIFLIFLIDALARGKERDVSPPVS